MSWFTIWLIGFILTTTICGVLHKKEIGFFKDWYPGFDDPNGSDNGPPHIVAGMFWFIIIPIVAVVYAFIGIYKGFNYITDFLSKVRFER